MDLLTLTRDNFDFGSLSDFKVANLVEGWSSLIWTERYQDPGEFELKTPYITETMALLPEFTYVTLRQTSEIMMVESLEVGTDANDAPELTVKGRSISASLMEVRFLNGPYNAKWKSVVNFTNPEMVEVLYFNALYNSNPNLTQNATISGRPIVGTGNIIGGAETMTQAYISESTTGTYTKKARWLASGNFYDLMKPFMLAGGCGVRTIRPGADGTVSGKFITVDDGNRGTTKGTINRITTWGNVAGFRVDIYDGTDKSASVIFSYGAGHLVKLDQLFSVLDFRSHAWVASSTGSTIEVAAAGQSTAFGVFKRVLYVDGGQPDSSETNSDFLAGLPDVGSAQLKLHNKVRVISADLSPATPYTYGIDYSLGDLVSMVGKYPIPGTDPSATPVTSQVMRVSEYVRTQDKDGERSYPGLALA